MIKLTFAALLVVIVSTTTCVSSANTFWDLCDLAINIKGCSHFPTTTSDGFVLDVVRFPNNGGYPIFLQHGLMDSGITWFVSAHPEKNLANILYEQGFDVWISNSRGNYYSRENVNYPSQQSADYFDLIDWDQMNRDTQAIIAKIKEVTAKKHLSYVGHSQGTTSFLAGISSFEQGTNSFVTGAHEKIRAEIVDSVDVAVLLAPVARVGDMTSLVFKVLADLDAGKWLALFGAEWFLESKGLEWLIQKVSVICDLWGGLCDDMLMLVCGNDAGTKNINATNLHSRVLKCDPGGTSVKNMRHWASAMRRDDFAMFNYDTAAQNMKAYNQSTPPVYNVSSITAPPLVMASAHNDALADPKDVEWLVQRLAPGGALKKHIDMSPYDYAHLDFVWGENAHVVLYPQVLASIRKYMKN